VAFSLKRHNAFKGIQADRALWAAMHFEVPLAITFHTIRGN
jgi:hypothetical protein